MIETENEPDIKINNIPQEQEELLLNNVIINDIDIDEGLEHFTGNEEVYIKVLHSYALNTRPLLNIIRNYIKCGNLRNYAFAIHGIKGSSLRIGADWAGAEAQRLEQLAKAWKKEQVLAENEAFIGYMEKLLDSIDNALLLLDNKCIKPAAA